MKTIEELREFLEERGFEGTSFFENPGFVDAIIGVTDVGNLVYDYDKMIQSLVNEGDMDDTEAMEWIDYNTLRTIPYMGGDHPIIVFPLDY